MPVTGHDPAHVTDFLFAQAFRQSLNINVRAYGNVNFQRDMKHDPIQYLRTGINSETQQVERVQAVGRADSSSLCCQPIQLVEDRKSSKMFWSYDVL